MFLNTVRKDDIDAPVECLLKFTERVRVTCYNVTVKKDSLLVYHLILVGQYGSVVVRERDKDMKDPGF